MDKTNYTRLVDKIAIELSEPSTKVKRVLDCYVKKISELTRKGKSVHIKNFGTFRIRKMRKKVSDSFEGEGRNREVKEFNVFKFTPTKQFKKHIQKTA